MNESNLSKWLAKCKELRLSPPCTKGLSFILGFNCLRVDTYDQSVVDANIEYFIDANTSGELFKSIDRETSALVFFEIIPIINALSGAFKLKFPEGRLDSNGKPTKLFDPNFDQQLFLVGRNVNATKLKDFHEACELFFSETGKIFSKYGFSDEQAFAYGSIFTVYAGLEDANGLSFFDGIFIKNGLPPLFNSLLSKSWNELNLKNEGYLPFQTALGGYIQGLNAELCNFIWTNQRILFFDQKTLAPINLNFQWASTEDFIKLLRDFTQIYWAHDSIKDFFKQSIDILKTHDVSFDSFVVPADQNLYQFLLNKVADKEGYVLGEIYSESNSLQYKACYFFMFLFALAANGKDLVFQEYKAT